MKCISQRFFLPYFILLLIFTSSCRSKAALYDPPPVKEGKIVINIETLKNEVPDFFSYISMGRI